MRGIVLTLAMRRDPAQCEPICEWMRRHGIDPNEVLVPSMLFIDDGARTISYTTPHLDEEGRKHLQRGCPSRLVRRSVDFCTRVDVVQLESPALPFPDAA